MHRYILIYGFVVNITLWIQQASKCLMQNAGQYVPGAANAHPTQQFVPSEPSPNGGTTTSSLRQFRKRDVDKSQLEQPPKQESHVARVAPHNHYPPVSNDLYRYQSHQFSDYSPQVKYSDITDASQPNQISTSVIQKPKPKDYMEMCNVQQAQPHISNQQPYSPDNGQYIHRDPMQGYPSGYKPEAHYLPKDQHQYQQLPHHAGQPKFNPMMTQNMRKYNPGPADNPFLNKLSKIHPSMARSIISDHHLQDPQPSYSPMDQRSIYGQQNHRYYSSTLHQANLYGPNPNYPMNPTHHYPNYSSSCSYPRTPTIPVRYSHMERSMSPSRRGYPENVHMNLTYHNTPQKMPTAHNYSPQYGTGPEYAQHYQHRRLGQDCYPPQPCRPAQYMQNHHQLQAQEMQELPESRISPSDSLKKFIENWAADEEPAGEINSMETNMSLRDNVKVRDDAPPGTVYMINATDVQYFENNGIPIVTSDNGGIQLTSENYQYLLKNGLVDNSGMVRIIEANKEISIDSSGNHERIVNLQIMETSKPDCMMVNKSLRPNDGINGMLSKIDDDNRRVVIHQNTIISPGNCIVSERVPSQQPQSKAPLSCADGASISISKELVDKNCSPINLDQLEHNIGFSELDQPETDNDINASSFVPESTLDSNDAGNSKEANIKSNEINVSAELSEKSEDSQNKSPGSKSMPIIIDLFADSHLEENDTSCVQKHEAQSDTDTITGSKKKDILATNDADFDSPESKVEPPLKAESHCRDSIDGHINKEETVCHEIVESENRKQALEDCSFILAKSNPNRDYIVGNVESTSLANSVIVSPDSMKKDAVLEDDTNYVPNFDSKHTDEQLGSSLKKNHEKEIDTSSESRNCNEPVLARSPVHSEVNVDAENKAQVMDQTNLKEYPSRSIERRKRIFSVDDIIHYIGNNIKKASTELDTFCSAEALSSFIEKEIEFSSLQQMAKVFYNKRTVRDDETLVVNNTNVEKRTNFNESVERTNIPSCSNPVRMHNEIKDNKKSSIEREENLEVKNEKIKLNIKSSNDDLVNDKQEIVGNQNLENATIEKEESTEDEHRSSDPSTVPIVLDERSNTPSAFQYRNAIRIDESSVLLQIAGELMEISVNVVNGKKVITVVPLSETTVVDYNDNYEVSGVVQESVEMDDSGINSEETDIPNHEDECEQTKTIERAYPENQVEDSFISTKEIPAISCHEQEGIENKEKSFSIEEKLFDQNQSTVNLKLDKVLQEGGDDKIQEENTTNSSRETDTEPMLDILEDITRDSIELSDKSRSFEDDLKTKLTKLPPKFENIPNTEIIQSYDILNVSTVSQVIEVNKSENIVIEESVKSFHDSVVAETNEALQFSELDTDSKTFPDPESLKDCTLVETKEKTKDTDKTEDLNDNSQNRVNSVTSDDVQLSRKDQDHDDVLKKLSPEASIYEYIESEARAIEPEKNCLPVKPRDELYDKSLINILIKEDDEDDLDTEHLDYQLEDDVFISEEPSHEIIVTDPLEGVGLIEEIDKTSDSFDIPLEPVTASDEFVETSQHDCEEKLEHSNIRDPAINDFSESSDGRSSSLPEGVTKKQENIKLTNEDTPDALPTDLEVTPTLANPYIPIEEETSIGKTEKNKELLVRHNKPEVQILSPTSTNIDDHVAISKENVYLGPIRRSNTDDETESTFVPITTKAAKKLYECDLQIPAVTTSGDISTKVSKKSIKHQHNNVSSSKKERVVKDLSRSKKGTLKRSKRINEKNLIKNEQKEMLRLLAEKRKQRKEAKQEAMRQRGAITENNGLVEGSEKLDVIKKIEENKRKHSTENDDEYVDFKELLRARKLKKLKKMQEIRQKEVREIKNKIDEAGKDKNVVDKSNNLVADGKEVNKSIIVSSSLVQENNGDKKIKCCIGCNNSVTKSNKDDKIKSKKRQSSSDDKNSDDSNTAKEKKCPSTPTITNSASELDHFKSTTSAAKIVLNIDSDKFSIKSGVPSEIKPKEILQTTTTPNVNIEEKVQTVVSNMEDAEREEHLSQKIKPQKRVSFCDDISSSTSNNEKFGFPSVDNTVPTKIRASSCANPKDPRRRSKSYSGQVMVPSVSELIEENNGGIYKKKISLADYVSRKRKTSTENHGTTKTEETECLDKKTKFESSVHQKERSVQTASGYKSEEDSKIFKKTIKDVKTSFVIHSSDWEDSQSPIPTTVQSNEECLIQDFSGLIKSKSKKPVIDVNELNPVEMLENPKDKKLQEYKDKVDSQLSSLNIQIPKIKSQNSENKRQNLNLDPSGSPESSSLIKKFLSSEKITQSEMEKIKKIISYKRLIQHQKNSRSPSKSPASTSSTYSQSSALSSYEPTGKAPCTSESAFSGSSSDPSCEVKNHITLESDSRDRRLHLKKVNAKRKLHLGYDDESSSSVHSNQSENINKKNVDYSVINRLGKDGLPKIIFKRNRQSNISDDNQLVVELERIDNNLELLEEKYNVTVTQMM